RDLAQRMPCLARISARNNPVRRSNVRGGAATMSPRRAGVKPGFGLIQRKVSESLAGRLAGACDIPMTDQPFPSIAFLWPALAAASTSGMMSAWAAQFAQLAGNSAKAESAKINWATPNRIALERPCMRLREFCADPSAVPTLVCAPFALHRATIADFAP